MALETQGATRTSGPRSAASLPPLLAAVSAFVCDVVKQDVYFQSNMFH